MELFSCRVCGKCHLVDKYEDMLTVHGFSIVKNIDGPNLICRECCIAYGVKSFIEDGYDRAYIENKA